MPHDTLVAAPQVPVPSQSRAGVSVEPVHDSVEHAVPAIHLRQAPAPSHMPSSPQLEASAAVHSLSGSLPAVMGRQRPSAAPVLVLAQALQRPVQAVSQQTPSTQ